MAKSLKRYTKDESRKYFQDLDIDIRDSVLVRPFRPGKEILKLLSKADTPEKIYDSYESALKYYGITNKAEFMCNYYSYIAATDNSVDNTEMAINFAKNGTELADSFNYLKVPFVYKVAIEVNRRVSKKVDFIEKVIRAITWAIIYVFLILTYQYLVSTGICEATVVEASFAMAAVAAVVYVTVHPKWGILNKPIKWASKLFRKVLLTKPIIRKDFNEVYDYVQAYEAWDSKFNFFTDRFYKNSVKEAKELLMSHESDLTDDELCSRLKDFNPNIQGKDFEWELFKTFKFAETFVGTDWKFRYLSFVETDKDLLDSTYTLEEARNNLKEDFAKLYNIDSESKVNYPAVFKSVLLNTKYKLSEKDKESVIEHIASAGIGFFVIAGLLGFGETAEGVMSLLSIMSATIYFSAMDGYSKLLKNVRPLDKDEYVYHDVVDYIERADEIDSAALKVYGIIPEKTKAKSIKIGKSAKDFVKLDVTIKPCDNEKTEKTFEHKDETVTLSKENIEMIKNPKNEIYFDGDYASTNGRIVSCFSNKLTEIRGKKFKENKADKFKIRLMNIRSKLNNLNEILKNSDEYFSSDVEICKKFYRLYLPGISNSFESLKKLNETELQLEYMQKLLDTVDDILTGILDAVDESVKLNVDVELDTLERLKEIHGLVSNV